MSLHLINTDFKYLNKEDYDKKIKVNGEYVGIYSKNKLKNLYPNNNYSVVGETFENKKRDKQNDIGKVEIAEKRLYVSNVGKNGRIFRKVGGFAEVEEGFIALLKLRLLPIILIIAILFGSIGFGIYSLTGNQSVEDPTTPTLDIDPNIQPTPVDVLTISGTVYKGGVSVEGATIVLQDGSGTTQAATSDKDGKYLVNDVPKGSYNLVCTVGNSVLTKLAIIGGKSIVVDFYFPDDDLHDVEDITDIHDEEKLPDIKPNTTYSDVKAIVKITNENTPNIAVGGLDTEAMLHMIVDKEVDITLLATKLEDNSVPKEEKTAIEEITGELNLTFFDFSVLKEIFSNQVLERTEYLSNTKTVLEVAVPYNSSKAVGTYVFRYHNDSALRFEELEEKPTSNYKDGTYYITANTVYVYTDKFSTYAIGSVAAAKQTKGSDTLTYSSNATVDLKTGNISMLYQRDADSTTDAKVEIYLVGENANLLIAQSGIIPAGNKIEKMTLLADVNYLPSVGTYNGIMKIIYISEDSAQTDTNVDIPLNVSITQ